MADMESLLPYSVSPSFLLQPSSVRLQEIRGPPLDHKAEIQSAFKAARRRKAEASGWCERGQGTGEASGGAVARADRGGGAGLGRSRGAAGALNAPARRRARLRGHEHLSPLPEQGASDGRPR